VNPEPVLLGIPHDASSSFLRGAALAPARIRKALASPSSNLFSESLADAAQLLDHGDLPLANSAEDRVAIEAAIRERVSAGLRPLCLGGDHSVTYPILRGLAPAHRNLTLVDIDAHPDLYDEFQGDSYSHACWLTRSLEEGLVKRVVQVGIRGLTPNQQKNVTRFGIEVVDMRAWAAGKRPVVDGPAYLSIDIDGIDPAFAPGVSHREPGGLSVREVITLVQSLTGPIVGADIVEYNPEQDWQDLTARVCAKLVKEVADALGSQ
jgi:agmatinase